jgi:hypothetical protein
MMGGFNQSVWEYGIWYYWIIRMEDIIDLSKNDRILKYWDDNMIDDCFLMVSISLAD